MPIDEWHPYLFPCILIAVGLLLGGCTGPPREDVLLVPAGEYGPAFDAVLEAARVNGLPAVMRDRRAGIVETDHRIAPSVLEPWDVDGSSMETRIENTIARQRRQARFEFTPAAFTSPTRTPAETLTGPDLLSPSETERDLTAHEVDLELRVWVFVERSHTPGLRRDTWSRAHTRRAQIIDPTNDGKALPGTSWSSVSRDQDLELRLLASIRRTLEQQAAER